MTLIEVMKNSHHTYLLIAWIWRFYSSRTTLIRTRSNLFRSWLHSA